MVLADNVWGGQLIFSRASNDKKGGVVQCNTVSQDASYPPLPRHFFATKIQDGGRRSLRRPEYLKFVLFFFL